MREHTRRIQKNPHGESDAPRFRGIHAGTPDALRSGVTSGTTAWSKEEPAMKVGRICQRTVAVAAPADTLVEAARRMRNLHVGDLVVVVEREGKRFAVGILTDRDIVVSVIAADATDVSSLLVADVMTGDIITISEHDDIFRALRRMRQHGVRR